MHKYRRTPKLGSAGTPLSWDGRRGPDALNVNYDEYYRVMLNELN